MKFFKSKKVHKVSKQIASAFLYVNTEKYFNCTWIQAFCSK